MKNMKKLLSLVLTVLMIMSSAAMIVAHAEVAAGHTCADVSPKDHYCDDATCGKAMKSTAINFNGMEGATKSLGNDAKNAEKTTYTISADGSVLTVTAANGNSNYRNIGLNFSKEAFPVRGHVYEITYWMQNNTDNTSAQVFSVFPGLQGYSTAGNGNSTIWYSRHTSSSNTSGVGSKAEFASDANGIKHMKVVVNGINNTVSLYIKQANGSYFHADTRLIAGTPENLALVLRVYYGFTAGQLAVGDVSITELCADTNGDHKCDTCEAQHNGCYDVANDKDHLCETCGKAVEYTVNWDNCADSTNIIYTGDTIRFEGKEGGIGSLTSAALCSYDSGRFDIPGPINGGKYEISYWVAGSDKGLRASLSIIDSTTYTYTNGSNYSGRLGWTVYTQRTNNKQVRFYNNGSSIQTVSNAPARDIDENGRQHFKVIVDAPAKTMSLYVLSGGEYKLADTRTSIAFGLNSRLRFTLFVYDTMNAGDFIEVGGITIKEACTDKVGDNDHLCDTCSVTVPTWLSDCSDAEGDYDHQCDECGKDGVSPCVDAADDGDHICDECEEKVASECKNEVLDHNCDTDSACTAYLDCVNDNGDAFCDICNKDIHACIDQTPVDHICDICGKDKQGTHADNDNDHLCDECGKPAKSTVVNFNGMEDATQTQGADANDPEKTTYNISDDGTVITVTAATNNYNRNIGLSFSKEAFPVRGHVYEITYWMQNTTGGNHVFGIFGGQGYTTTGNYIGYARHTGSANTVAVGTRDEFAPDADGIKHFKVIVNGINNTVSLYVKQADGSYFFADTRAINGTPENLSLVLRAYYGFNEGQLAVGDVSIAELCADADGDHKCDTCGEQYSGCYDVASDKDHLCEICGKVAEYTPDWGRFEDSETIIYEGNSVRFEGTEEGVGSLTSGSLASYDSGVIDVPGSVHAGKYEISYWIAGSDKDLRASLSIIDYSTYTVGDKDYTGRLGWTVFTKTTNNKQVRFYENGTNLQTVSDAPARDFVDGKQYFKVIIDGPAKTISLYVLSDGEYKLADTKVLSTFGYNARIRFQLFVYDKMYTGDFVEVGGLTIKEACMDKAGDSNHLCEICNEAAPTWQSPCIDSEEDTDHKCDECGKDGINPCTDALDDGDHKCDICGAENVTECTDVAGDNDHDCDECGAKDVFDCTDTEGDYNHKCDECGKFIADAKCEDKPNDGDHKCDDPDCGKAMLNAKCEDKTGDGDHKCDDCGADNITDCADVANDGDHKCDECGKGNMNACADVENDGDHKCDECGETMADAKCFDKEGDGDHLCEECGADNVTECADVAGDGNHNCDECGKRASRCVDEDLDILCDECGVYMNHICVDASADHHCDICGEILSDHADVNKNHACDVCGKKMGDHKLADGKHVCDYCGIKMTACADKDADQACDVCGKAMPSKVAEETKGSINVAIEAAKAQAEAAAKAAAEAAAKAAQKVVEKALEDIFAEDSALMGGIESIGGALSDVITDVKANIEAKLEDALNELKELLKKAA